MRLEIKLTEKGRKHIANGDLNFKWFTLGDSEVDYSQSGKTLSVPQSPVFTSYLQEALTCNKIFELTGDCTTYNRKHIGRKQKQGIFTKDTIGLGELEPEWFKLTGTTASPFDGDCYWDISGVTLEQYQSIQDGDFLMVSVNNDIFSQAFESPRYAVPYLVYSVTKEGLSTNLKLDRNLPYLSTTGDTQWWILPSSLEYFTSGTTIDFTNFDDCAVCSGDTLEVITQHNVFCAPPMGTSGCTAEISGYPSSEYLGIMKYLGYCGECPEAVDVSTIDCTDVLNNQYESRINMVSILEFEYLSEDYFFVNSNNDFKLYMPMLMWHRRWFETQGDLMGMVFKADTTLKRTDGGLGYYELLEDQNYIGDRTPIGVGRVYPDLKIATLHHPELVAATSYFSNRNWTLPALKGKMVYPINGIGSGILGVGKTMYLSYELEATTGITYTWAQQKIAKFTNNTSIDRDISFTLDDVDTLKYMRKLEPQWDGMGFYGHKFNLLYQIVDSSSDLPLAYAWKKLNFTTNNLTTNPYESIDPLRLERQEAELNQFILTSAREALTGYEIYSYGGCECNVPIGVEWLFMGNASFSVGTTLFRRLFKIMVGANISATDNVTYVEGNLKVSEIAILNSNLEPVVVAKMHPPVDLRTDGVTEIDLEIDF